MALLLALLAAVQTAPAPTLPPPVVGAPPPVVRTPAAPIAAAPIVPPPAAGPTRAVPAVPLHRLISDQDYPAAAIRAGEQGVVRVALDIAPEGRVTGCTIIESSRSAILDSSTCRILRSRARFTPARDADGKAVADRLEANIAWRMSASAPRPPSPLDAPMQAWLDCLQPTLARGDPKTAEKTRALAQKAFAGCHAPEERLLAVIAAARTAARPVEEDRAQLREQIIGMLEAARLHKQR